MEYLRKFVLCGTSIAILALVLSIPIKSSAQAPSVLIKQQDSLSESDQRLVLIDNIFITGNKKTRDKIILREISVEVGKQYQLDDLNEILTADRNNIYNTKLFNTVEASILELGFNKVDIVVNVDERWYLFPIPLVDIIDRNFNDWWVNQDHDFSRIIYGLSLYHFNMRGMNERMTLTAQFGYSKRYEFEYEFPYIDRSQRNGLGFFARYQEYTNLHYDNIENLRAFFDSESVLKTNIYTGVNYTRRKSFYTRHYVNLRYSNSTIADTIIALNPNYLGIAGNKQVYFSLQYTFSHDKRDIVAYPLAGYNLEISAEKFGLGIFDDVDIMNFRANYSRYIKLPKGFYFSNYSSIYLSTPNNQPYSLVKGLGFSNDVVRGYELYVIHGQHYFVNKTSFKKVLFAGSKQLKNFPLEQFRHFPYAIYLKTYFDIGYSRNTQLYEGNALLADKLLYGGGLGLDIVTMYDVVIRLEYSVNSIGEGAFFFNIQSEF
jgi:outer membrane protein assembly factor BamA